MSGSIEMDGEQYSEMVAELAELRRRLAEARARIRRLEDDVSIQQAANSELLGSIDGLNEQYDAALAVCQEQQGRIASLSAQLADELVDRQRAQARIKVLPADPRREVINMEWEPHFYVEIKDGVAVESSNARYYKLVPRASPAALDKPQEEDDHAAD